MKIIRIFTLITLSLFISCATFWAPSGNHIHNKNDGNVGIGTADPDNKLTIVDESTTPVRDFSGVSSTISSPSEARAVYGAAIYPNSTWNYGGYFTSAGESSGVFGEASDKERGIAGGIFHAWGTRGKGVIGLALNTDNDVTNYGGWFDARGENGVGIFAEGGKKGYAAHFVGNVQIMSPSTSAVIIELGEGLDYAEGFDVSDKRKVEPGSVLVIDPDNPGKLTIGNTPYDKKVAGIVSGAKGLGSGVQLGPELFDVNVALAGRVYCNVDAIKAGIEPGDLLTTSEIPGYAMKVVDLERAKGAILGKAMEKLEKGKKGQILVLVTLQ